MKTDDLIADLPGEAIVREGLADVQSGNCTIPACLVSIGRTRLMRAGILKGDENSFFVEPERQMYRLLRKNGGDAYSRYNALLREFISFEQALDRRLSSTREKV